MTRIIEQCPKCAGADPQCVVCRGQRVVERVASERVRCWRCRVAVATTASGTCWDCFNEQVESDRRAMSH